MFHNFLFLLVICGFFWDIQAQHTDHENSRQVVTNNNDLKNGGFRTVPKFIVQTITKLVKNIFQNLKNILQRFEKYAISMMSDTLSFLARNDNTAIARRRRSPWIYSSEQDKPQKGGGVISTFSNLFMMPFKWTFGAVKWVPGAIFESSTKIGFAMAGDVLDNPIFKSLAQAAVTATEKVAEESWNFAKVNLFPRMDKWVTSMRESHTLPDSVSILLTEIQTLYHLYRFLGLA